MAAAVDRLEAEQDDRHRRRRHLGQEDLLRRRRPQRHDPGRPRRRRRRVRRGRAASRPSCAGWRRSAGRSSPRSTAPRSAAAWRSRSPATTGSRSTTRAAELGLPEVTLGLLPGGGGVDPRRSGCSASPTALMDVLLHGHPVQAGRRRWRSASSTSWSPARDELVPAAKAWILGHRDDAEAAVQPWDRPGYRMPGGTPSTPKLAAFLPAFPANLRKQTKGADYPAPRAILAAAVEGAQVDFDTATRIESRYLDRAGRRPELQEHDPGVLLRPAGDQLRRAAARGRRRRSPRHQARRARRRDDGRRHRLLRAPAPASRWCSRTSALEAAEKGKALLRDAARQGGRRAAG